VEYREADTRQRAGARASGDDTTARFLHELRQLRIGAGLGHAELAARAHFPYDSIVAAEAGPGLPDLPVFSAYVRACGGTAEEWEERWRSLTSSPSLPLSTSRSGGRSDAATAGARIGSTSQAGDSPDPSIIIAALSRVAEEMASSSADEVPADAVAASSGIQPAGDILSPDTSFPSAPRAVDSVTDPLTSASSFTSDAPLASDAAAFQPTSEPVTSGKPAGWDPIRVSTAWPAIRDPSPLTAESAGSAGSFGGTGAGAPWGAASRTEAQPDAASPTRVSAAVSGSGPAAGRHGGPGRSASRTRVVVLAVVLLCVLAVLLAVFA
jgi:hypothetical protein